MGREEGPGLTPRQKVAGLLKATGEELIARGNALLTEAELVAERDLDSDPLLDLKELKTRYYMTRAVVLKAAQNEELAVIRGAKGRILVRQSEAERWNDARPLDKFRRKRRATPDTESMEEWDRQTREEFEYYERHGKFPKRR